MANPSDRDQTSVREQLLAAAENDRHRKNAHRVDQIVGEQRSLPS